MSNHVHASLVRNSLLILGFVLALSPARLASQEKKGAGAVLSPEAKAKDVGLPLYPGSKPHKDKDEDSSAANLGLWGGGSGFTLAVLKMESTDPPEKVAEFYRKSLSRYGAVLDCSKPAKKSDDTDSSKALSCGDDKPETGGVLLKAGTKEKQHIVEVRPNGHGTIYHLVYLASWSDKGDK